MNAHPNKHFLGLLDQLHLARIPYAILRDNPLNELPLIELDLLVDASALQRFTEIALANDFQLIRDGFLNPGKVVFVRLDGQRPHLLDVHLKMIYRGLEYMSSRELIGERVTHNGYFFLDESDGALALLLHNVLSKKRIQEKHREKLAMYCRRNHSPRQITARVGKFGIMKNILSIVKQFDAIAENPAVIRQLRHALRKKLRRHPANLLRVIRLRFRFLKTWLFGKKRGLVIAFIGPDGAGKSSLIGAIQQLLRQHGLASHRAYMGPWGGSILKLRKIFFWLNPSPYRSDYKEYYAGKIEQKPGPLKGFAKWKLNFRSAIYYTILWIEMRFRWLVRVLPAVRQGKVVLTDRYIYDILTGYKNRPMDYQQAVRTKMCVNFPKPHIGILLDCESQIIFSRKPQLSQAILDHSRQAYQQIATQYNFQKLDTSESIEQTLADFEREILPVIVGNLSSKLHISL